MSKQLIYALSSIGQVTLDRYNELFRMLYFPVYGSVTEEDEINHRNLISRIFESLGYFEFDFKARKLFMCPPALVMLPSQGLPRCLLTGARTPALLAKVKSATAKKRNIARIHRHCQAKIPLTLPDVIWVEAADIDSVRDIADESGILLPSDTPAGWEMANLSASINDIEGGLDFVKREDINWKKRTFDRERLRFGHSSRELDDCLLAEYTHPLTQQKVHWIWNGAAASEINRDWGRYSILKNYSKSIIMYDESKEYLGIPLTVPLPRILARAAALCSGKAPFISRIDCQRLKLPGALLFYIYTEVPGVVAQIIAQKTGQQIMLGEIYIKNTG